MFDRLTGILVAHGIAPVYQPVFHGYGWKGRRVAGWWQGHEAWCNLTAGGTMGLVYGAGSLWQWRLHAREPDHADWCTAPGSGWREAQDFEGSRYPGVAAKIFDGLSFAEMQPNWTYTTIRLPWSIPSSQPLSAAATRLGGQSCSERSAMFPREKLNFLNPS